MQYSYTHTFININIGVYLSSKRCASTGLQCPTTVCEVSYFSSAKLSCHCINAFPLHLNVTVSSESERCGDSAPGARFAAARRIDHFLGPKGEICRQ